MSTASKLTAAAVTIALAIVLGVGAPVARADATGRLTGTATWSDGRPGTGVKVGLYGSGRQYDTVVDSSGHWLSPPLPADTYHVLFSVLDSQGLSAGVGNAEATVTGADQPRLATTLSGGPASPVLQALITGRVTVADGTDPSRAGLVIRPPGDGPFQLLELAPGGGFSVVVPAGTWTLGPETSFGTFDMLDAAFGPPRTVTLAGGETATFDLALPARPVTPGAKAAHAARDLGRLNAERRRWGLPAGIAEVPLWSQACGSHDGYLAANNVLQHPENPGDKGYSDGGDWAGTHSVLSRGAGWRVGRNPWEDAPIHLIQLFTPGLTRIGIDESHGFTCATTWPGIGPTGAPGSVLTYPGDGSTGLPPAELAAERPFVPGQFVGIPPGRIAGRELFVYEQGASGPADVTIQSVSLVDAAGHAVAVRSVDASSKISAYLTGAIVIPVKRLRPHTRYTATVRLAATEDLPATTHRWSFTTGAANPSGLWPAGSAGPGGRLRLTGLRVRVVARHARVALRVPTAATVRIVLSRSQGRRSSPVAATTRRLRPGRSELRLAPRLAPGRYRLTLRARTAGGRAGVRSALFRVRG